MKEKPAERNKNVCFLSAGVSPAPIPPHTGRLLRMETRHEHGVQTGY